jgi:hypothetical protein
MKGVFNITNQPNLTKGKIYNIRIVPHSSLKLSIGMKDSAVVTCDDGVNRYVNINNFTTIEEHRDNIINDIINETSIQ